MDLTLLSMVDAQEPSQLEPVTFRESSLLRRSRNVACKIFDMLKTLYSMVFGRKIQLDAQAAAGNQDVNPRVLSRLQSKGQVSNIVMSAMITYVNPALDTTKIYDLRYVNGTSCASVEELQFQDKDDDTTKIAIPFVIDKGWRFGRAHIVLIMVDFTDRENPTLHYFDSKGLTVADRKVQYLQGMTPASGNPGITVQDFIQAVARKYRVTGEVRENTEKTQYDSHTCGLHVGEMVRRFFTGQTPETAAKRGIQTSQVRRDVLHSLLREE